MGCEYSEFEILRGCATQDDIVGHANQGDCFVKVDESSFEFMLVPVFIK